jgi:hypothetical protein
MEHDQPPKEEREMESSAGGSVKMRPYAEFRIRALMRTKILCGLVSRKGWFSGVFEARKSA